MAEDGAAHRNEAAVSLHEINRSLSLRPRRHWADTGPVRVQVRRWRWDGCTRGANERARRIPTEPSAARPARRPRRTPARRPRRTPARSCAQRSSHRAPGRSTGPSKIRSAAPGGPAALTSAGASPYPAGRSPLAIARSSGFGCPAAIRRAATAGSTCSATGHGPSAWFPDRCHRRTTSHLGDRTSRPRLAPHPPGAHLWPCQAGSVGHPTPGGSIPSGHPDRPSRQLQGRRGGQGWCGKNVGGNQRRIAFRRTPSARPCRGNRCRHRLRPAEQSNRSALNGLILGTDLGQESAILHRRH
jgi:hypothetical protein